MMKKQKLWQKALAQRWQRYPARVSIINGNRRARIAKAVGSHTAEEWLPGKAMHAYLCAGCGDIGFNVKFTEDHIIPMARGGSNFIGNIQPLCARCNSRKWAKMPAEVFLD